MFFCGAREIWACLSSIPHWLKRWLAIDSFADCQSCRIVTLVVYGFRVRIMVQFVRGQSVMTPARRRRGVMKMLIA
jgi:hypothetical protein